MVYFYQNRFNGSTVEIALPKIWTYFEKCNFRNTRDAGGKKKIKIARQRNMHAWKRYAHDVKIYRSVNSSYILNIVSPSILSFAIYRDFSYVFCNSLGKEKDRGEKKKNPGRERNFISTRYSNENASDINTNQFSRRYRRISRIPINVLRSFLSLFFTEWFCYVS